MKGIDNINAVEGFSTAISGMLIVFVSLVLISLYITVLPRILELVHRFLPESDHPDEMAKAPAPKKAVSDNKPLQQTAAAAAAFHKARGGN